MRRTWLVLSLVLGLSATAAAQQIRLRITPRQGGGETIGVGRPREPEPTARLARARPTDIGARIDELARAAMAELASKGRLPAPLAADTARELSEATLRKAGEAPDRRVAYNRTLSYAAAASGDLPTAREAATQWRQAAPTDPAAIRNQLMLAVLAGDGDAARAALASLADKRHARWLGWTTYMRNFLPLVATKPRVKLAGDAAFDVAEHAGEVVVLSFTTAAADPLPARLAQLYSRRRITVQSIRLGPGADPSAKAAAGSLRVTAAPTGVVLGRDGRVLFAGDPRTWEIHTALQFGLSAPDATAETPVPQPQVPLTTPARRRDARKLRDRGWDMLRLGLKTHSAVHQQQGRQLLSQCIRDYPNTAAATQARRDLADTAPGR